MKTRDPLRPCRCGAAIGGLHETGCDKERCTLCGGQLIGCDCVYTVNGIDPVTLETSHPDLFNEGPTDALYAVFDAEVERYGGKLPWSGEYPGSEACREFDLWCRWQDGMGWMACDREHPQATEDLNRLHQVARWHRTARAWVQPDKVGQA